MEREEAIRRIKAWNLDSDDREVLAVVIPELAESEDERIRQALIEFLREAYSRGNAPEECAKWLVWLDRQKEQEPVEGEWPYNTPADTVEGEIENIWSKLSRENIFMATKTGFREVILHFVNYARNNAVPEWSEEQKEQKPEQYDIDVLEKHITKDSISELAHTVIVRNGWEIVEREQKPTESISQLTVKGKGVYKICPRCKERMVRDDSKVYTSMPPQYGYECPKCGEIEFDTIMYDNPEMKEQKPAEWSKNDTVFLNEITDFFENKTVRLQHDIDMYAHWLKSLPERFVLQPKQEWNEEDEKTLDCIINILDRLGYEEFCKSSRDQDVEEERFYYKEIQCLKRLKSLRHQQKVEWSEEDRAILKIIASDVGRTMHKCGVGTDEWNIRSKAIRWLETLCPNQKSEWSDEDADMLNCCISSIEEAKENRYAYKETDGDTSYDREIAWLKSLRPSWKPSEEQMKQLHSVLTPGSVFDCDILNELYRQLEKLM